MLDLEFKYFREHQDELVKRYNGRYIVIVGEEVVGDYKDQAEAYVHTAKTRKPGTFLIQHCIPGPGAYKQTFHSRVAFV